MGSGDAATAAASAGLGSMLLHDSASVLLSTLAQAQQEAIKTAALTKAELGETGLSFLADDTTLSFENL